jgi:hypothetical protein
MARFQVAKIDDVSLTRRYAHRALGPLKIGDLA